MPQKKPPQSVCLDLTPEELEKLLTALDQYDAYLNSQHRSDSDYRRLMEKIKDAA